MTPAAANGSGSRAPRRRPGRPCPAVCAVGCRRHTPAGLWSLQPTRLFKDRTRTGLHLAKKRTHAPTAGQPPTGADLARLRGQQLLCKRQQAQPLGGGQQAQLLNLGQRQPSLLRRRQQARLLNRGQQLLLLDLPGRGGYKETGRVSKGGLWAGLGPRSHWLKLHHARQGSGALSRALAPPAELRCAVWAAPSRAKAAAACPPDGTPTPVRKRALTRLAGQNALGRALTRSKMLTAGFSRSSKNRPTLPMPAWGQGWGHRRWAAQGRGRGGQCAAGGGGGAGQAGQAQHQPRRTLGPALVV